MLARLVHEGEAERCDERDNSEQVEPDASPHVGGGLSPQYADADREE